ncbi:MAG: hypothetical protein WAT23_05050 [Chromatiaceae bacterium]
MNAPTAIASFSDRRVFPVRPGDPRLGHRGYEDDAVGHEQCWDGPVYLVIGSRAPADALDRACHRFGVDRLQMLNALAQLERPA